MHLKKAFTFCIPFTDVLPLHRIKAKHWNPDTVESLINDCKDTDTNTAMCYLKIK